MGQGDIIKPLMLHVMYTCPSRSHTWKTMIKVRKSQIADVMGDKAVPSGLKTSNTGLLSPYWNIHNP